MRGVFLLLLLLMLTEVPLVGSIHAINMVGETASDAIMVTNVERGNTVAIQAVDPVNIPNIIIKLTYDFPKDAFSPTISIISPSNGATVNGTITIEADVRDDSGILWVAFLVDNCLIANLTSPPWKCTWDTTQVPDGYHTITVKACNTQGNMTDVSIKVYVSNADESESSPPAPFTEFPVNVWIAVIVVIVIMGALITLIAFILIRRKSARGEYMSHSPLPPPPE